MTASREATTVFAPEPEPASGAVPVNRVLSVRLSRDETVEWVWSTTTEGVRYVSGFNIVKTVGSGATEPER